MVRDKEKAIRRESCSDLRNFLINISKAYHCQCCSVDKTKKSAVLFTLRIATRIVHVGTINKA